MRLSSPNLELLRTRPQSTRLHLSIFQPRTIFQAQVNDASIDKGARTITYDSVSLGSFSAIEAGMTLLVGTTAGGKDVGKIRIRSATSSIITVSENSNIEWANDLFLTVQRYWELWPVYPRIIQDPANVENVIFYKDYDIAYSNQNSILGTFLNIGPHRAAFLEGGSVQLWYSSTGTFNLLGNSLNYNWSFEGGTPTGSSSANPGYVAYNTPGHYVTRCITSGSSGEIDTRYAYVSIYDREGVGNSPPILKWEVNGLNGSRDEGGHKASFKVHENINIEENAVVVLFSDDWYGSTNQSLGGNYPNAEKIFFVGYILQDSIHYDYQHSYVEFEVASITSLMKNSLGFSVTVESKSSPTKWFELLDMDCRRAIYHYLRWHTTALNIADFQFVGDDRKIQFFDADRASMYDAVDNLMRNTLIGKSVSDRQGKTWMEVDAKAYPNPTGSFTSVMEILKRDWMNEPSIDEQLSDSLSYLEYGGIAYSGVSTGTFSAILASAPGNTPSFRGKIETHEGLALLGQTQLNQLVANVWANENSKYPKLGLEMGISARSLDIAPQETADIHILASDTARNLAINGLYIPTSIDWKYDSKNAVLLPSIDFTNLITGAEGETIDIATPSEGVGAGFVVPGLQLPAIPALTIPGFPGAGTGSSCCDALAALGLGLGVYSGLFTRNAQTPALIAGAVFFTWEYASNPKMYDVNNGHIPLQNTGTIASYTMTLSGRWTQTHEAGATPGGSKAFVEVQLYTVADVPIPNTGVLYSVGQPQYNGGASVDVISDGNGDSGLFTAILTVSADSNFKMPAYCRASVEGNSSPPTFQVLFDLLRFTIEGTA